jgi:phage host-nuclease inhibitor protein Gam
MGKAIKKAQEIAAEAAQAAETAEAAENTTPAEKTHTEAPSDATGPAAAGVTAAEAAEALAQATAAMQTEQEPPAVTLDELEGLDMDSFGRPEADEGPRPAWRITDDGCADWAVRKIAEEKAELDRIKALADEQIQRIEEKVAAAEKRFQNGTSFLTGKLAEYFQTVPHKTTKTKHSYRLLSGTLTLKLGGTQLKQNDDALLEYLKTSGNDDMIQTVEKPKWGEFKKRLQIVGASVVDGTTGEIVEGVEIINKPDTFTVDV